MDGLAVLNYGLAAVKIGMADMMRGLSGGARGFGPKQRRQCEVGHTKTTYGVITAAVGFSLIGMPALAGRFVKNMAPVLSDPPGSE